MANFGTTEKDPKMIIKAVSDKTGRSAEGPAKIGPPT